MILVLPFYSLSHLNEILAAAKLCKVIAIANVNSGPGSSLDPKWKAAIKKLKDAGVTVIGYIDLVRWPGDGRYKVKAKRDATSKEILDESRDWDVWYDVLSAFYDDATSILPQFTRGSVFNFGCEPTKPSSVCISVVHEGPGYLKSKTSKVAPKNQAVMALGEPDFWPPLKLARERKVAYFFASNRSDKHPDGSDDWSTYDAMPSYLTKMATEIGSGKPS